MASATAILFALYFLPTIVAVLRRQRQQMPILILNAFLGWTLIAWVICLSWASSSDTLGNRRRAR